MMRKTTSPRLSIFTLFGVLALLLSWPSPAHAESGVRLRLNKLISEKMKIAVPDFSTKSDPNVTGGLDHIGKDILINDLLLSGLFDTITTSRTGGSDSENPGKVNYDRWTKTGAQLLVLGDFEKPAFSISVKMRLFDLTTRTFLFGKRYQGEKESYRWIMHRFADEIIGELTNIKGSSATKIVFCSQFRGSKEVYTIDQDGNNPKRMSFSNSISVAPTWSHDGEKIAYTSYRYNNPNLFVIKRAGGKRKMISNRPGLNDAATWSPDGEKIAFVQSTNGNPDLFLLYKDGTKKRLTYFRGIDTSPAWSPDGKKLAYTSNRSGSAQIYIIGAEKGDKGKVKRISYSGGQSDDPVWSPDGSSIAYSSLRNGHFEIVVEDFQNNINLQLTTTARGSSEHPTWSPDGRFIAFSSSRDGKSQIYIMRSDGSGVRKLTYLRGGGHEPSWSPRLPH